MSYPQVLWGSRHGKSLDIKTNTPGYGPYEGFLFEGKYITLRGAGDILAGINARTHGDTSDNYLRGAGAYEKGFGQAAINYFSGRKITFGPPPFYGETPYAGFHVQYGYNLKVNVPLTPLRDPGGVP